MEVYEQHGDLEQVRGLLGHARIDTTQVYAQIRPPAQAVGRVLRGESARGTDEVNGTFNSVFEELLKVPQTWSRKSQPKRLGGPNGIRAFGSLTITRRIRVA